jgi:hypothetical protein
VEALFRYNEPFNENLFPGPNSVDVVAGGALNLGEDVQVATFHHVLGGRDHGLKIVPS